ncbi:MAG: putative addiction module antidote protein [Leptospirales bacterium]|nr:putative addiction module antidote protein [Leptospirales bacterium]
MAIKTTKWDMAEFIETKEDVAAHLTVAFKEKDMDFLMSVIDALARSKGMSRISKELGVTREGLYKSFSKEGNPSFLTVVNVLDNLGYGINIYQKMAS